MLADGLLLLCFYNIHYRWIWYYTTITKPLSQFASLKSFCMGTDPIRAGLSGPFRTLPHFLGFLVSCLLHVTYISLRSLYLQVANQNLQVYWLTIIVTLLILFCVLSILFPTQLLLCRGYQCLHNCWAGQLIVLNSPFLPSRPAAMIEILLRTQQRQTTPPVSSAFMLQQPPKLPTCFAYLLLMLAEQWWPGSLQVYCIFLFLTAASLFGTLISEASPCHPPCFDQPSPPSLHETQQWLPQELVFIQMKMMSVVFSWAESLMIRI